MDSMWYIARMAMEIILLRHGRPAFSLEQKVAARELPQVIADYNRAGVRESAPAFACDIASSCEFVVCSDLPRSIQSAQLLGVDTIHLRLPLLREFELPVSLWPSPRLPGGFWFGFFRLLWLLGHSADGESLALARDRAALARQELTALAQQHGRILFVGHGLLNQFIAKELVAQGWLGPKRPGRGYWDCSRYQYVG